MPIYEYWCAKCGKEFEQMRPMSQSSEPGTCPTCGSKAEKVPSVFASKENYTIKVPRGPAFRQRGAVAPAAGSSARGATATKTAAPPKSGTKSGAKSATASAGSKAGSKASAGGTRAKRR